MKAPLDLKITVNLPRTGFPMKAHLPQRAPQLLERWERERLYHRIRERRRGAPRFILLWRWTYNNARAPFDEARKLATAVGTELTAKWGPGQLVSEEKEYVRVLGPKEREKDTRFVNRVGDSTMVHALHRACIYWECGERKKLDEHLRQTYGANDTFRRIAQNIAGVLPEGDKERQLLQGLLYGRRSQAREAAGQLALPGTQGFQAGLFMKRATVCRFRLGRGAEIRRFCGFAASEVKRHPPQSHGRSAQGSDRYGPAASAAPLCGNSVAGTRRLFCRCGSAGRHGDLCGKSSGRNSHS